VDRRSFQRVLDVNWRKEGDEWVDHLFAALQEEITAEGHSAKGRDAVEGVPVPHVEYTAASVELTSALRLIPLETGVYVLVTGESETPSAGEIDPWCRAAEAATERVGRSHKDFRWSAVIGPLPGLQAAGQVLEEGAEIGGLALRSGGVLHQEPTASGLPSFYAPGWSWSSPVNRHRIVTRLQLESRIGRRRPRSPPGLRAPLGCMGLCWGVREAPAHEDMGERTIPEHPPFYKDDDEAAHDTTTWVRSPVSVPDWPAG
jgi:hypothetical protein